ncbi:MAG: hypothetical protein COU69_01595 [Candidatus Pacebacteria bacterium CG10_big_fil_rev_8_21_14_0_10_56_10]|nr:MAG: hypothetical protein COU69_01595 [Candidatus Pacebacteria bacterium CG10_big_fil_rev_8_21_14_0_10_56_10]
MKPQVSVVMATHNEAANIKRSLSSVLGIAEEIIVVDGQSSDRTVELARGLGAEVTVVSNKINFHINKQLAMDKATGELVLQLDADEVVDDQLAAFIRHTASDRSRQPAAWWVKRQNFYLGSWLSKGGQYPDPVIRLYRRGRAKLPQQDVHEQMAVDGQLGWADGHLLHYSMPNLTTAITKLNTYTSFMARQYHQAGLSATFFNGVVAFTIRPVSTFVSLYWRHRGYVDGVAGLVFALMSALHQPIAFLKLWELSQQSPQQSASGLPQHE